MPRTVHVAGTPAPQGSKTHVGGGRMIESSKAVKPWREAVRAAWADEADFTSNQWQPLDGPVSVEVLFILPRPAGHFRPDGTLRPTARPYPHVRPDLDKYLRATLDALGMAGAFLDDSQVVDVAAIKRYAADGAKPGALIHVTPLESP